MSLYKADTVLAVLFFVIVAQVTEGKPQDSVLTRVVFSFGSEGDGQGQFRLPGAISIDARGWVYVADTGNNRIQKFDHRGRYITMIGGFGWDAEHFQRPLDVCAENGLDVFVADYENRRVERYDKDLHWIATFKASKDIDDRLVMGFPSSVGISIHGDLFIVDQENKRVLKLNTLREPVISFGDYDWGDGALSEPMNLFVSRNDRVFVTDAKLGRVLAFDYYGNYLYGIGEGVLKKPCGICIDHNGRIFVTDLELSRVIIYSNEGQLLLNFGSEGNKLGAFLSPSDVAVYKNWLYVSDTENHRIQVFDIGSKVD